VRKNPPVRADDGGGSFVAARFKTKDDCHSAFP